MIELYWINSCFMLVFLTILIYRIWNYIEWNENKYYALIFVGTVEVYVLLDALFMTYFLDKFANATAFQIIVTLFYLVYISMPFVWHLFMQNFMGIHHKRIAVILDSIPFTILLMLVMISIPTGCIWSISSNGAYTRGPLFGFFAVFNLFYYFYAFIQTFYILVTDNTRGFHYFIKSSLFSAIPLIGILVNTYLIPLYGIFPFQPYCLVIGVLLVYLFMVEHQKEQTEYAHREKLSSALKSEQEASQKAQKASAVKDTFLANMSHDIRTPMNAILGFADIIARHPDDETTVKNSIAKIQTSGDILLHIINDVLDLSKIESGKLQITEVPADLNQIIQNLGTMMEYSIRDKQIHFKTINDLRNPYVWCDTTKLQQVLVNVLNNAVKFTPQNGTITLKCTEYPVSEAISEYTISIKDTGIGMDKDFQKHAFEAFERERTSTESQIEGTGLGLSIVKKLMDLMNGQVTIQSELHQGTEICIKLQLKKCEKSQLAAIPNVSVDSIDFTGSRVLLVEDNSLNAEIAIEFLTNAGLLVDWVKDGCSCIEQLEHAVPAYYQFILMDIQMPRMNGYDATRKIRQMEDTEKAIIPIIAMTANAFDDDRKSAFAAGMNGFIAKPIELDKILQAISEIYQTS